MMARITYLLINSALKRHNARDFCVVIKCPSLSRDLRGWSRIGSCVEIGIRFPVRNIRYRGGRNGISSGRVDSLLPRCLGDVASVLQRTGEDQAVIKKIKKFRTRLDGELETGE